ncbi:gliomedin [Esox lucius]|nr:gliomedin [Esox lucius]
MYRPTTDAEVVARASLDKENVEEANYRPTTDKEVVQEANYRQENNKEMVEEANYRQKMDGEIFKEANYRTKSVLGVVKEAIYRTTTDTEIVGEENYRQEMYSEIVEEVNKKPKLNTDIVEKANNLGKTDIAIVKEVPSKKNNTEIVEEAYFRKTECIIKSITCSTNVIKMETTFGVWMQDAAEVNDEQMWTAEHFSGRVVQEYKSFASFPDSSSRTIDIRKFHQGCGHVVYHGNMYFHNAGTSRVVKFNMKTSRLQTLAIENALYRNLTYLFHNSKTYFKFTVDENGLWLIFASDVYETIMVAKLDHKRFFVLSVVNTSYPIRKAGNAFIVCGVLYLTDAKDSKVIHAIDLMREKDFHVSLNLRPTHGIMAMLSYYPNNQLLYMWDNSCLKMCTVHFA